jgi:ubiquinone/menaquinone biosynthesis C-methylase UbiE
VAEWYDELVGTEGSEYQQQVVHPGALRLLHAEAGEAVLDIACGQGVFCRILHGLRVRVTGVDAARELIKRARQRGPEEIQYQVADARDLSTLAEGQFDATACILAIQNINPIGPVFEGARRALKPGGRLVLVMMHPCFRGAKETSWGWDEGQKVQYRRVDRYMLPRKAPIITNPGKDPDRYTWTFHKPLEAYIKALGRAGLLVDTLEEWTSHKITQAGPRAAAENLARKEIPMFMALRAIKVERLTASPRPESMPDSPPDGGRPDFTPQSPPV